MIPRDRFGSDLRRYYTVWRFTWPDGRTFCAIRPMHPDDQDWQHAGQRILWQGKAVDEAEAYANAGVSYGSP